MIDWVHAGCSQWGDQMRLLYVGKDGWPARSMLAKIIEEGILGHTAGRFMQYFPECLNAEAVRYNAAIKQLDEQDRESLFIHYVCIGKGKAKAVHMGVTKSVYYAHIDLAQKHLSRELSVESGHNRQISRGQTDVENSTIPIV